MTTDCKEVPLIPPDNFIEYNIQTNKNGIEYKDLVYVDECLADEIKDLWKCGVRTCGCCCGHGKEAGWIGTRGKDIKKMEELGYEHASNDWILEGYEKYYFKAKTKCKNVK